MRLASCHFALRECATQSSILFGGERRDNGKAVRLGGRARADRAPRAPGNTVSELAGRARCRFAGATLKSGLVAGGRNLFERVSAALGIVRIHRQITQRDDTDKAVISCADEDAADLFFFHEPGGFFDILILVEDLDVVCHDLTDRGRLGIESVGNGPDGNVAIGDDSDRTVVIDDRKKTHIHRRHALRGMLNRGVFRHGFEIGRAHV